MVPLVDTGQNPQKVLSNFLSVFWDFGHICMLLEIYGTFSGGSEKLLFFQSMLLLFVMVLTVKEKRRIKKNKDTFSVLIQSHIFLKDCLASRTHIVPLFSCSPFDRLLMSPDLYWFF